MRVAERLSTIAATATLTSAAWIVAGTIYFDRPGAPEAPKAPTSASPATTSTASGPPGVPPASSSGLIIPVAGVEPDQLVDTFAVSRGGARQHNAIDIMAPRGTPVLAAAAGTVEKLYLSDNGGMTIYVRSPDRTTIHYYAHLDRYAEGLKEGETVSQGEVLGAVGSTGDANPDAPHLHFEVLRTTPEADWWDEATPVNPYPLLGGKRGGTAVR